MWKLQTRGTVVHRFGSAQTTVATVNYGTSLFHNIFVT